MSYSEVSRISRRSANNQLVLRDRERSVSPARDSSYLTFRPASGSSAHQDDNLSCVSGLSRASKASNISGLSRASKVSNISGLSKLTSISRNTQRKSEKSEYNQNKALVVNEDRCEQKNYALIPLSSRPKRTVISDELSKAEKEILNTVISSKKAKPVANYELPGLLKCSLPLMEGNFKMSHKGADGCELKIEWTSK